MLANLVIAAAKFAAALITSSSAMLSEGIHSLADTANQGLLLIGDRRSRKPPDAQHPFGYGRQLYFWSLVVAMVLFGMGGGLSLHQGIEQIRHGSVPRDPGWNYLVLGVAFAAEGASFAVERARQLAADEPAVLTIRHAATLHISPDEVLLNIGIQFDPAKSAADVAAAIQRLERRIREADPRVTRIFVEVEPLQEKKSSAPRHQDTKAARRRRRATSSLQHS